MTGPLALVGGAEFQPGNEEQDRILVEAAAGRPAHVVCAAVRERPDRAAASARRWFATLGVDMTELRVRSRTDGSLPDTVHAARRAGLVYIAGGDPGRTVRLLAGSPVWEAIVAAWHDGAAVAGSSAGAMALCRWTLVRDRWPDRQTRRPVEALGLVPGSAVLPHFDTFGQAWIESAQLALGPDATLIGVDERTAAVWSDGGWTAMGPGRVTLITGEHRDQCSSGEVAPGLPHPV